LEDDKTILVQAIAEVHHQYGSYRLPGCWHSLSRVFAGPCSRRPVLVALSLTGAVYAAQLETTAHISATSSPAVDVDIVAPAADMHLAGCLCVIVVRACSWNPVQCGSWQNRPARVLECSKKGNCIATQVNPRNW
jgi:hypothetical protein